MEKILVIYDSKKAKHWTKYKNQNFKVSDNLIIDTEENIDIMLGNAKVDITEMKKDIAEKRKNKQDF